MTGKPCFFMFVFFRGSRPCNPLRVCRYSMGCNLFLLRLSEVNFVVRAGFDKQQSPMVYPQPWAKLRRGNATQVIYFSKAIGTAIPYTVIASCVFLGSPNSSRAAGGKLPHPIGNKKRDAPLAIMPSRPWWNETRTTRASSLGRLGTRPGWARRTTPWRPGCAGGTPRGLSCAFLDLDVTHNVTTRLVGVFLIYI